MEPEHTVPEPFGKTLIIEQREGEGEDAPPVLEAHHPSGFLAVFDGLGGAGGASFHTPNGSSTGAYVASRLASKITLDYGKRIRQSFDDDVRVHAQQLKAELREEFRRKSDERQGSQSKLRSPLIRQLPTTAAIALYHIDNQGKECRCHSLWAGDSRTLALSPTSGLHQLSIDDLKSGGDALHNLIHDSPLSNYINADTDFRLNGWTSSLPLPVVVIAATDGCFAHLYSPQHFEHLLLSTLVSSTSVDMWFKGIESSLRENLQDDASIAAVCLGWPDFQSMANDFVERETALKREYVDPMDQMKTTNMMELHRLESEYQEISASMVSKKVEMQQDREDHWLRYKTDFEKHTPTDRGEERGDDSLDSGKASGNYGGG